MRWDIFCQIVDNYGDAGVCWRLAKSLTSIHKQEVRLYCDDLPSMHLLVAGYFTGTANNPDPQIEILPWEASFDNARHTVLPPDVVVEAFGCNPPNRYLSTLLSAPRLPLLMNLEYLSAERWVGDYHAKPSPQSHGLPKVFFFPGFDTDTGGLLIDPVVPEGVTTKDAIPASLSPTWSHLRPHARRISVFCYPDAPLRQWLEDLAHTGQDYDVLLAYGQDKLLASASGEPLEFPATIKLFSIPFVPQDDYDWLLSQCELNIVRGEDSFVRAQLAGRPFIWHIYPQEDGAHEGKLAAFLARYLEYGDPKIAKACRLANDWALPSLYIDSLPDWKTHAKIWRKTLLLNNADGGLAGRLMQFATRHR